jgi:ATP-dependent RNA helicase RhlE
MNSNFSDLALIDPILRAINEEGYTEPTPIQVAAIPMVLEGKDLLATAQTGTGKTAAFAIPILQMLCADTNRNTQHPRALILTPTRELALQIDESFRAYGRHMRQRTAVILGGVSQVPQMRALRRRPDIVVATPGRLLDLMSQGHVNLSQIEMLVLDEADRMLDMGFVHDVRRIVSHSPKQRQTLLFSATLSSDIKRLASDMLIEPEMVAVTPAASVSNHIEQRVLFVEQSDKRALLEDILGHESVHRALVFTRTKHRADRIARQLSDHGISADAIHSNKSQGARQRALAQFDQGRIKVLVGTDIVARGIDVNGISHVINFEMPNDPESYVHRIGRTARAGADGVALSLCALDELGVLNGIEKLTKSPLIEVDNHPFHSDAVAALHQKRLEHRGPKNRRPFGRNSRKADPWKRR